MLRLEFDLCLQPPSHCPDQARISQGRRLNENRPESTVTYGSSASKIEKEQVSPTIHWITLTVLARLSASFPHHEVQKNGVSGWKLVTERSFLAIPNRLYNQKQTIFRLSNINLFAEELSYET